MTLRDEHPIVGAKSGGPRASEQRSIMLPLGVAGIGFVATLLHVSSDPRRAMFAWAFAFAFAFSTTLAALILVMILDVTGATWSLALRPMMAGVAATTPVLIVLFVPILVGLRLLYPWAEDLDRFEPEMRAVLAHQRSWNNPGFFTVRSALYLGLWALLGTTVRSSKRWSAVGLPLLALSITFASYDWLMSLEAGWVSTIFGLYVFASGFVSATGLFALLAWRGRSWGVVPDGVGPAHFHALGRLMLTAVLFWAYIAFFQLLLIWIANLPREVGFYLRRSQGSFAVVSALLVVGHFALPLLALLSRSLKRSPPALAMVGAWLFVFAPLDFAWLVLPARTTRLLPLDVGPSVAVTGLAFAYGSWRFVVHARTAALDPKIAESLRYESP